MLLADRTVLLVDADGDLLDRLASDLKLHGARCFPARDRATATWGARETLPDAVVCRLAPPGVDAQALVTELQSAPESAGLRAVALHAPGPLSEGEPPLAEPESVFQKYLTEPVGTSELVDALCCVLGDRSAAQGQGPLSPELTEALLARHDYRQLLAGLNAETEHRYSAFFKRRGDELCSVWTFDRERPESDPLTGPLALAATPCAALFETGSSRALEDATRDAQPSEHGYGIMRAFVGAPLAGVDAVIFGAVCHFSPEPRARDDDALRRLEVVAKLLVHGERRRRPR